MLAAAHFRLGVFTGDDALYDCGHHYSDNSNDPQAELKNYQAVKQLF
jgi:hypothetical protein